VTSLLTSGRDQDAYAWNGHGNVDGDYGVNGLNQLTNAGTVSLSYDGRGNLTSQGAATYTYTSENRLAVLLGAIGFRYENSGNRIMQIYDYVTAKDQRFGWSGDQMISEVITPSWTISRRYVFGPGDDAPLVWYEGSGTNDKRWLIPDERGSIIAVTNASGAVTNVNRYDEYGLKCFPNSNRTPAENRCSKNSWGPLWGPFKNPVQN
jgi:hypothetical protein